MSRRTTLLLALANLAALAFIYFVEQGRLSTAEVAGRSRHVLTRFVRDRVERVELVRGDAPPVVLVRHRDDPDELGTWSLEAPLASASDDDAVDGLLSALEWLDARRTLVQVTPEDRQRFGLETPRFVVRFAVAAEQVELRVGGAAPTGEGVYVAVVGEDGGYVVGNDFVESIDHDFAHFRSKRLFASFYPTDAILAEVTEGGVTVRLEQQEGVWRVVSPVRGLANASLVDRIARGLRDLEARRFVTETVDELSQWGLDSPWREVRVERPEGAEGRQSARLRVGAACGDHEGERYAVAGDQGPVVCVRVSDLSEVAVGPEQARESRLLTTSDDAVERVELRAGGRPLELRRDEDGWTMSNGSETSTRADDAAVAAWLAELRALRVVEFDEGAESAHGLASPTATLVVHRSDEERSETVQLGSLEEGEGGVWVHRGDEEAAVRFAPAAATLFMVSELRFRDRELIQGVSVDDARLVSVVRNGVEERAVRGEGGAWMLEVPTAVQASRTSARAMGRRVAELRALRWVSARATSELGFDQPTRVEVRFEPEAGEPRTIALQLGSSTVEGGYGRIGEDGPVFELARDDYEVFDGSLVDFDLMAVDVAAIRELRIEGETGAVVIRRGDDGWRTAGDEVPDAARTRALMDRLGTLRASRVVRFGVAPLEAGTSVTGVLRADGDDRELVLSIGEPNTDGFVPVWRDDIDVALGFRAELLEPILTYAP